METGDSCWVQIGIVSWGYGCGESFFHNGIQIRYPGYYTNVVAFVDWIKNGRRSVYNKQNSLIQSRPKGEALQRLLKHTHKLVLWSPVIKNLCLKGCILRSCIFCCKAN